MTRVLPSGLEAKTGYVPEIFLPLAEKADRHFVLLGESINPFQMEEAETKMMDAILAIADAFENPQLIGDPVFEKFKQRLASFIPRVTRWSYNEDFTAKDVPVIRIWPPSDEAWDDYDVDDPGPEVEVLGHTLTRNDLIAFTYYVMENSSPEGSNDPRLAFIEGLKLKFAR